MASSILDLIQQQVSAQSGSVQIPANVKDKVLNGLSDSIFSSLAQTATKVGGIEQLKSLLTGRTSAESSPITALAGNIFNANILKNLNLGSTLNAALSGLIPTIMGKLSGILKDQDGDGDVDFNDILIALKGGNRTATSGGLLGGILGKVLGGSR
jgi:hypothetical protein